MPVSVRPNRGACGLRTRRWPSGRLRPASGSGSRIGGRRRTSPECRATGVRCEVWIKSSTTPNPDDRYSKVRVTHRFHPLYGREFEFVVRRLNWGEDRVYVHDENGELFSFLTGWTDAAPVDPFVEIAD